MFSFITREMFDLMIIGVILVGLVLAGIRLYQDLSRPVPLEDHEHPTQPSTRQK